MRQVCIIRVFILIIIMLFSFPGCGNKEASREIRIGAILDLTGPTAETGNNVGEGIKDYVKFINEKGGVNGRKVKLIIMDTAYILQKDLQAYKKLVNEDKVHFIFGWSTTSTEELQPQITKDQIPSTGVSFSNKLADINKSPYYFMMGPPYSNQIKVALKFIVNEWKDKTRKPKVAFIYSDTAFGKAPIPDGREYAAKNGVELVAEEIVFLDAREARGQLQKIKEKGPDYVIINETANAAAVILRDAKKINFKTKIIGLIWSCDEKVIKLAGQASEGYYGVFPSFLQDTKNPDVNYIFEANKSKGVSRERISSLYLNGWIAMSIMLEGVKRAGDDLSGKGIRKGLESLSEFNTGGMTAPFTFNGKDHVGFKKLRVGRIEGGKWKLITDFISAD